MGLRSTSLVALAALALAGAPRARAAGEAALAGGGAPSSSRFT